nr:MAG TPA: hypothetical protein [Caudoviricetes sp.]
MEVLHHGRKQSSAADLQDLQSSFLYLGKRVGLARNSWAEALYTLQ